MRRPTPAAAVSCFAPPCSFSPLTSGGRRGLPAPESSFSTVRRKPRGGEILLAVQLLLSQTLRHGRAPTLPASHAALRGGRLSPWAGRAGVQVNAAGNPADHPLAPTPSEAGEGRTNVWLRYVFEGGKITRDSKLVRLELNEDEQLVLPAERILQELADEGVDLSYFIPGVYDDVLKGFYTLEKGSSFNLSQKAQRRIDVRLMAPNKPQPSVVGTQDDGYFQIGVVGVKTEGNIGTLWRSAYQMGAAGIFMIGHRFAHTAPDITIAYSKIPLVEYPAWNDFARSAPYSATWVAVEMGGEPLETFEHPKRAVYILGSEDNGLPGSVVKACHKTVSLPSVRYPSFNVAVAGSIIMYDRLAKQARAQLADGSPEGGGAWKNRRSGAEQAGEVGGGVDGDSDSADPDVPARDTPGGRKWK